MDLIKKLRWRCADFALFGVALAHIARFGMLRRVPPRLTTIAVVQGAKMGDMVCTTPLFRAIKQTYPAARIVVVGDAANQKLLAGHPAVARYIMWEKDFWSAARALRSERIDYGIVALPSLASLALLAVGGARAAAAPVVIGGISAYETRLYRLLHRFAIAVPHHFGAYVPREYLRLLEPIGIVSDDTRKWLSYSATDQNSAQQLLAAEGLRPAQDFLVGMTPAVGGNPRKRWAPEKFAALADYVARKYSARVVVVGAGRDAEEVKRMLGAALPETRIVSLQNRLSLGELKALIASLSLFISADTGPIYIAEAFGVPTIDIVGPMDENAQPPRGEFHRVVAPPRARAAFGILNHDGSNPAEELRQAEATTVEMVQECLDDLIPRIISSPRHSTRS